ncbi:MAG: arginine--tRNA ligase [Desulfurococcales archaeon]|nr:arginine--tRNA ligase [Desulfurococcales archaeon]
MSGERLDPYTRAVLSIVDIISERIGEERLRVYYLLSEPREELGDLSFPAIRFRRKGVDPSKLAEGLIEELAGMGIDYVGVEVAGPGYINFRFKAPKMIAEIVDSMSRGVFTLTPPKTPEPKTLVVEHTSANPIHPMHMGHARNMSLGDTLARLLRARGHKVNTRFYVDDVGKQVAIAALGVKLLGIDPLEESRKHGVKPDELVGWVYAVTNLAMEVSMLKKEKERGGDGGVEDKLSHTTARLLELKAGDPGGYFDRLVDSILNLEDPEAMVSEIMRRYEAGLEPERGLIRGMTNAVLEGFKITLARMGVEFDDWDWESDMVWSGRVEMILDEARSSPFYTIYKGAEALDLPRFIRLLKEYKSDLLKHFKLPKGFEIPPLILRRSDGTTLYVTRDMAYTLYKFEVTGADKVYNVIGADQRLSQLQLRLALAALGHVREAVNLVHYEYELVTLPGVKMSARRGTLVKLDDMLDGLKHRAFEEVKKRNPDSPEEWVWETAEKIARAALRFRLVQISAPKPITFNPEAALDLQANSGPYLQYTHARASGILRKLGGIEYSRVDPEACKEGARRRLLIRALKYPLTAAKAADDLAPEILATYLIGLADVFNSWYQYDSVIGEPSEGAKYCKAVLVRTVKEALKNGLALLGVEAPERM